MSNLSVALFVVPVFTEAKGVARSSVLVEFHLRVPSICSLLPKFGQVVVLDGASSAEPKEVLARVLEATNVLPAQISKTIT